MVGQIGDYDFLSWALGMGREWFSVAFWVRIDGGFDFATGLLVGFS